MPREIDRTEQTSRILACCADLARETSPRELARDLMAAGLHLVNQGWGEAEAYGELRRLVVAASREARHAHLRADGLGRRPRDVVKLRVPQ